MTNHSQGHDAEKVAAKYLKQQGYNIMDINWRRPSAEVDIIARKKHEPLTFFEVKYRQTANQGNGLEYITNKKLEQMHYAAELWVSEHGYDDGYMLGAISLSGPEFTVTDLLTEL